MYDSVCMYVCMYVCMIMYVCMCVCMYNVCMHACMYVCMIMNVCMCMYMCIYVFVALQPCGSKDVLVRQCLHAPLRHQDSKHQC